MNKMSKLAKSLEPVGPIVQFLIMLIGFFGLLFVIIGFQLKPLENNQARLESNQARLESNQARLESNQARLETELLDIKNNHLRHIEENQARFERELTDIKSLLKDFVSKK